MTVISGMNNAALLILQQAGSTSATDELKSDAGSSLVAVANGVGGKIGLSAQPGRIESKISEAMFSVENVNINKLKLELIERAGQALGFDESDYETKSQFASAMRKAVIDMQARGADQQIAAIEKELGLDELGVSLLDVVSSARNPELDDKVTTALKEREGIEEKEEAEEAEKRSFQPDEIGLYGTPAA